MSLLQFSSMLLSSLPVFSIYIYIYAGFLLLLSRLTGHFYFFLFFLNFFVDFFLTLF